MTNKLPPIYFYIPQAELSQNEPLINQCLQAADPYWHWQSLQTSVSPMILGRYNWTLQIYLRLKARDFPCKLVGIMPTEGIVLSHPRFLRDFGPPGPKVLFVCIQADAPRHPYAQLYVVQNPRQESSRGLFTIWENYYVPHWPQAGLIARDPERRDKFENIGFFGNEVNLVAEMRDQAWHEQLKALGLNWQTKLTREQWRDYSNVDVVLAVRSLGQKHDYKQKPATKLYNAWHANVPAILGYESAFQAERISDLDYIEVTSVSETLLALKRLRDDEKLRRAMVENGRVRAEETSSNQMFSKWKNFITEKAVPAYEHWCSTPIWKQQAFFKTRDVYLSLKSFGKSRRGHSQ